MRRVAALVNAHAHRFRPELVAELRRALGAERVRLTRSVEEARAAVSELCRGGAEVLCVVGGDGTFAQAAADLYELAPASPPILFPLRGGLGNAISDISGASPLTERGLAIDLARARGDEPGRPLRLLRANGRIATYAGVGLDAAFVEDLYAVAKGRWKRAARQLGGAAGLAATVLLRSAPRLWRYQPPHVTITARGPAERLDERGRPTGERAGAGEVLFSGAALVAAGSTIASYGRGFLAFPLVERVAMDRFDLRVWTIGAGALLRHLPQVWRGRYAPPGGVRDWAVSALEMSWHPPHVIHIGGDLWPACARLSLELLPHPLAILRKPPEQNTSSHRTNS